jgi:hypothetical protein
LSGAMAVLAFLLKDGSDILGKRDRPAVVTSRRNQTRHAEKHYYRKASHVIGQLSSPFTCFSRATAPANNPIPYTSPEGVFPAVAGHPEKRSDEGHALAFS